MKTVKRTSLSLLLMLGCVAASCAVDTDGSVPEEAPSESVDSVQEPFNPSYETTDMNAKDGHVQITLKAFELLQQRGLLPAFLQDFENKRTVVYGVNFGDHPWKGRKEAPHTQVPTRISERLGNNTQGVATAAGYYETNVESPALAPDPRLKVNASTNVWWRPGNDPDRKPMPNNALMYTQQVNVAVEVALWQELLGMTLLGPFSPIHSEYPGAIIKKFAVDNLFHYSLGDINSIAPTPIPAGAGNIKVYPLTREHIMKEAGISGTFDSQSTEKKDTINKLVALGLNQPLLSGAQFGGATYGAILYQLARKFFGGSTAAPDLAELQKAGPTVPGWSTGKLEGVGEMNEMKLTFPHTYLGGNPYICSGSTLPDGCAAGKATWPVFVPERSPSEAGAFWLNSMEVAKPGRRNQAALAYLGWAIHMMEDLAAPHHAANWTGVEHDVQDGYGDKEFYYKRTAGKESLHMDTYMKTDADSIFGSATAPKTRDQVCQSLGVLDSGLLPGSLFHQAVRPLFINTAKTSYGQRQATVAAAQADAEGAKYVKNAILGAMKLIACAMPSSGYWPTTFASGFVWSGFVSTGTVPAPSGYSYNSQQGTNTITKTGTGSYRVDFPNLGKEVGGNVQVTAYGGTTDRCKVASWGSNGSMLSANVICNDVAGNRKDGMFTASYVRQAGPGGGPGGFLWANNPTAASYTPDHTYQWNSSGARNTIQRWGVGDYSATFPGISVNGGTVEVTAYGGGNEHCEVGSWGSNSVNVRCFTPAGQPVDAMFTLNFTDQSPNGTPSYHYAWADQPWSASYTPSTYYQKGRLASECSSAGTMTMARTGVGRYTATIPALSPTGSNVKITAYGGTADSCQVTGWGGDSNASTVGVFCHDSYGTPIDTYFTIVYSTNQYIIC